MIFKQFKGSSSPILKISNLQAGDYMFSLEVEDVKGQTSTADVHLVVLKGLTYVSKHVDIVIKLHLIKRRG